MKCYIGDPVHAIAEEHIETLLENTPTKGQANLFYVGGHTPLLAIRLGIGHYHLSTGDTIYLQSGILLICPEHLCDEEDMGGALFVYTDPRLVTWEGMSLHIPSYEMGGDYNVVFTHAS
jgi:hypothetical protein